MKTKKNWVIKQLLDNGRIGRNECLANYISRLGAIIHELKTEGFDFEAKYVKNNGGRDFVYTMTNCPYKKKEYRVNGELVEAKWVKITNK